MKQKIVNKENNAVKVGIYDQYFFDSFYLVRKELFKTVAWIILGFFLIFICVLFYMTIFEMYW